MLDLAESDLLTRPVMSIEEISGISTSMRASFSAVPDLMDGFEILEIFRGSETVWLPSSLTEDETSEQITVATHSLGRS